MVEVFSHNLKMVVRCIGSDEATLLTVVCIIKRQSEIPHFRSGYKRTSQNMLLFILCLMEIQFSFSFGGVESE